MTSECFSGTPRSLRETGNKQEASKIREWVADFPNE
jgi:hypothetical protein